MKKIAKAVAIGAIAASSTAAQAWWGIGDGYGYPHYGPYGPHGYYPYAGYAYAPIAPVAALTEEQRQILEDQRKARREHLETIAQRQVRMREQALEAYRRAERDIQQSEPGAVPESRHRVLAGPKHAFQRMQERHAEAMARRHDMMAEAQSRRAERLKDLFERRAGFYHDMDRDWTRMRESRAAPASQSPKVPAAVGSES